MHKDRIITVHRVKTTLRQDKAILRQGKTTAGLLLLLTIVMVMLAGTVADTVEAEAEEAGKSKIE